MPDDGHKDIWVRPEPSQHPTLADGEIHIWRIALDAATNAQHSNILSPDEHERAERLKIPAFKARFVAGRIALRYVLGSYLNISPAAVRFQYNPHGKPEIADPDHDGGVNDLRFNLTHSDSLALLALCHKHPIGIDLERVRHLSESETEYIANSAFTATEREALAQLSDSAYLPAFFRCWTRKEAVMKAHGTGFRLAQAFTVSVDDTPKIIEANESIGVSWTILNIPIDAPFVAALAISALSPSFSLRLFLSSDTPAVTKCKTTL